MSNFADFPEIYILLLEPNRSYILDTNQPTEGILKFKRNWKKPLFVFISTVPGRISHYGIGKKKKGDAGTDKIPLKIENIHQLNQPIIFNKIFERIPSRLKKTLQKKLQTGGLLPNKTSMAFLEELQRLDNRIAALLEKYNQSKISRLKPKVLQSLAIQKEAVYTSLKFAGIDPQEVINEISLDEIDDSFTFLDGLQGVSVREDGMIISDSDIFPEFDLDSKDLKTSTKIFSGNGKKMQITIANRTRLEEQTGADLIYYNQNDMSFIMVQYKVMELNKSTGEYEFRIADQQLVSEIERMNLIIQELQAYQDDNSVVDFRLSNNPFYFKLCERIDLNIDETGLCNGLYIPLEYFNRLSNSEKIIGPRGGKRLTPQLIQRKISNREFINMVKYGWIGSHKKQSKFLNKLFQYVIMSNRPIIFAQKKDDTPPSPPDSHINSLHQEHDFDYIKSQKQEIHIHLTHD